MEQNSQFLGTEPVGRLMRRYAVPCIISLLVGALYNIVDQIFIANASYLGSYGNAANTVVFPLTVVALAIAVMIGDGCCAFVSISLGQGDQAAAKRSVGNAVVMSVAGSLVLTAVYLLLQNQIIALFGGTVNEETFQYSQEYFFYISLGIPFYMFGQAMNPVIRADGNPRFAMAATLAGAAANIVLDPIFIFGCRWGMMGAAVATVIGQVITAALSVWYLLHMRQIQPSRRDFRLSRAVCGRTLLLGITSFLSQISLVAAMAAINYEMGLCKKLSDFAGQRPAGDGCLCRGAENAVLRTSGSGGSAGRQPERLPPSFWVQTKKAAARRKKPAAVMGKAGPQFTNWNRFRPTSGLYFRSTWPDRAVRTNSPVRLMTPRFRWPPWQTSSVGLPTTMWRWK